MTIQFEEFVLDNGLKVVVHEEHKVPIIAIDLMYHVGSKNEKWGKTGFAHLFEHLMFEGSKNAPGKTFDEVLQRMGASNNAYTSEDKTNYYEIIPSHEIESALWLESDRMRFLNVTQEALDIQRKVVMEERRQRVDNEPYGTANEKMLELAYSSHPYRWPVIGYMDHLLGASLDDVKSFYETFYAPNNATLVLAGDITVEKAKELTEKYFGEFKAIKRVEQPIERDQLNTGEKREMVYDTIQLPGLFMGYKTVEELHPDFPSLELLGSLLSGGKSSRLYQEIVYNKRKAQVVYSYQETKEHQGLFTFVAIATPQVELLEIEDLITKQIDLIREKGIPDKELDKIKTMFSAGFIEQFQTLGSKAETLAHFAGMYDNTAYINTILDRYQAVSSQSIQSVIEKYFQPENRIVLHYLPKQS